MDASDTSSCLRCKGIYYSGKTKKCPECILTNPTINQVLAKEMASDGMLEKARSLLTETIVLDPHNSSLHADRSKVNMERPDKAIEDAARSIAIESREE